MICVTRKIRIVQPPTINFIFVLTMSNLNYTVVVSLAIICEKHPETIAKTESSASIC